jgi:hypothetical protein
MYEKMLATRQAETHHDIHLSRKPAYIEQSRIFVEHSAGKRDTLLVEFGSRRQRTEQRREVTVS